MSGRVLRGVAYDWRLPCYAAVAAIVALLPAVYAYGDLYATFYALLALPIALIILLVLASRKRDMRWLSIASTLSTFALLSWALVAHAYDVHTILKWSIEGPRDRALLEAAPAPKRGDLRHVYWDSWGAFAMDTVAYLVYDPHDALANAARQHPGGAVPGIPCDVAAVTRLEPYYYSVEFYAERSWDQCTY